MRRLGIKTAPDSAQSELANDASFSEIAMQHYPAALFAMLALALGCACVHAEDFMPRASAGFAAGSDNPVNCPQRTAGAMSEATTTRETRSSSETGTESVKTTTQPHHVGVDESTTSTSTTASATSTTRKAHSGLRWQSLLPGVMK